MKRITLIRHAQAEDFSADYNDFHRNLTQKGINQSRTSGKFLRENNLYPDLFLCSPAIRTRQTAEIISDEISYPKEEIKYDRTIYEGDENPLLDLICSTSEEKKSMFICGHNPTLLNLSNLVCETKRNHFKKGYVLVLLFFADDWNELYNSNGKEEKKFQP